MVEEPLALRQHLPAHDGSGHEHENEQDAGPEERGVGAAPSLRPAGEHRALPTISWVQ
jgi:hypothetical protein